MNEAPTLGTGDGSIEPFVLDAHRVLVGDLVIDLALSTIGSSSQRSVKLSGNEFALLATLVNNTGRFVARPDLLTAIVGEDFEGDAGIVDVYVGYLRRSLISADSAVTIDKDTDAGYRLCP